MAYRQQQDKTIKTQSTEHIWPSRITYSIVIMKQGHFTYFPQKMLHKIQ